MKTYTITATLTKVFQVNDIEAESELEALATVDDWILDDFEGVEIDAYWEFETTEEDN